MTPILPGRIVYDIETYPNIFTFRCKHVDTGEHWNFEISFRRNDLHEFCRFIDACRTYSGIQWVGFNNIGFDYPVVHFIYTNEHTHGGVTVEAIYDKAMSIIRNQGGGFGHLVWESDHLVPQIDLFKIHHFDNVAKATSLKVLEFNMRMESVEDLPFPVGTELNDSQATTLCTYNDHDIAATELFYRRTLEAITLRESLSEQFGMRLMNYSDVKIGDKILIHEMERYGIQCYEWDEQGRRQPRQTRRDSINLAEAVLPYVQFQRPEFQRIRDYFVSRVITETNGIFKDLIATVEGCDYKFGTGGLHMSVESQIVKSTDDMVIVDLDVASYYPNLAIKNRIFPAHLGEAHCDVLLALFNMRKQYSKKDPRNGAFKLALNGVYGLSNNEYSVFYDPLYTMSITINGQLLLCMLVEQLILTPGLKMIQANTDGVTFHCPRQYLDHIKSICKWWEGVTGLELEQAEYSRMFIRDVNSYIAEKSNGEVKRIGAYAYETAEDNPATRELPWNKDWSARVVQLAAEAYLVRGVPVEEFIANHTDAYDFLLRTKVPRSSKLMWGDEQVSNIVRYYVSTNGRPLTKVMPAAGTPGEFKRKNGISDSEFYRVRQEIGPGVWDERIHTKNRSVYDARDTGIHTGWNVTLCNNLRGVNFDNINDQWYIEEAMKLVQLTEVNPSQNNANP